MPVESVLPLVLGISILSLGVAWLLAREVLAADAGKPEMRTISDAIREGAEAFLSRQYRTIGMLSIVAAAAIFAFYFFNRHVANIEETAKVNDILQKVIRANSRLSSKQNEALH